MFLIERLTNNIADRIALTLKLDKDKRDIIAYGAFNLLQTIWCIIVVVIFGFLCKVTIESLIVSSTIALLRKYSGGVHSSSPNRCAIIGAVVSVGLALLMGKISNILNIQYIILIALVGIGLSYYLIYKFAPVDSPAKPILKKEKKIRMRKYSIRLLNIIFIIIIILLILYFIQGDKNFIALTMYIYSGVVWQTLTLTPKGALIMKSIDNFLKYIISFNGGEKNEK